MHLNILGGVIHTTDASKAVEAAKILLNKEKKDEYLKSLEAEYEAIRELFNKVPKKICPIRLRKEK